MRTLIVTGNLASDPEILTRSDGSNYTKLRIGNHEYSDGKDGDTRWFTVFYGRTDGIINALKKGSGVLVMGDYSDSLYEAKNGSNGIDRTISATKIDFFSTAKREDNQQQPTQQSATAQTTQPETDGKTTSGKKKSNAPKPSEPTPAAASDVDDLPF